MGLMHSVKGALKHLEREEISMPKIGERRVMICEATSKPVIMSYEGKRHGDPASGNGHPYWLCLHNDSEAQDAIDVEAFRKKEVE